MNWLTKNDFELLAQPKRFALDEVALKASFLALQKVTHPDNFVNAGDSEKRIALQLATRVNEAYTRLQSPVTRAQYLCELGGVAIAADQHRHAKRVFN
jgi:molecular chaperone HscB